MRSTFASDGDTDGIATSVGLESKVDESTEVGSENSLDMESLRSQALQFQVGVTMEIIGWPQGQLEKDRLVDAIHCAVS